MYYGIDVSSHNGNIDWKAVSLEVDFAMLRIGYGKGNIDTKFLYNATECEKYGIPYGGYWFSYALNTDMAKKEAEYCYNIIKKRNITLPIAYDWEYDSDNYAKKNNIKITSTSIYNFATGFCDTLKNKGYNAMFYANEDYLKRGLSKLTNKYPLWFAKWSGHDPGVSCTMWQYTDKDTFKGIKGKVDADIFYGVIKNENKITDIDTIKRTVINNLSAEWWYKYRDIAVDVIANKYGTGDARKEKLKLAGYDPTIVQLIVNELVRE